MSFADRLKIARKEKGYSQEQLAEALEVSRQSITKWETGAAYPELRKLLLLSVRLEKDLDWLFFDERNQLNGMSEEAGDHWITDLRIHDLRSLKAAMRESRICRVLEALEGCEFSEEFNSEDIGGYRTYTVYKSRMYAVSHQNEGGGGADQNSFFVLDMDEAAEVLARNAWQLHNTEA